MSHHVLVVGIDGRMGRFARSWLGEHAPDLIVGEGARRGDDLTEIIRDQRPAVGLDLTVAGSGARHAATFLEAGVPVVIGTSGVTLEEEAGLHEMALASRVAALVVPNFSLGVLLQQRMAELAAPHMPGVEIIEEHHPGKRDAPSGTAIDTRHRITRASGAGERDVPIHSVRLEGLHSNQDVVFGGPGETLRISHRTHGLEAFGPGLIASLRYVFEAKPGPRRGLDHVLLPVAGS